MKIGRTSIKMTSPNHFEANLDDGLHAYGFLVGLICQDCVIIDDMQINTPYRLQGMGRELLRAVQTCFNKPIYPFAPLDSAMGFWDKWAAEQATPRPPEVDLVALKIRQAALEARVTELRRKLDARRQQ